MAHFHAPAARRPAEKRHARRWILLALAVLLLCGGVGAAWRYRANARLASVRELQKELFSPAGRQLAPDDRRQKFEQLRSEMNMLTAAQRQGLRTEGMKRQTEQINRYFALSKDDRVRYLDEMITRVQQRQRERAEGGGPPGDGGPAGPRGRGNNPGAADRFAPAAERDKRRQDFLDAQPASERAAWGEFRKELASRRQQLGLPPGGRP